MRPRLAVAAPASFLRTGKQELMLRKRVLMRDSGPIWAERTSTRVLCARGTVSRAGNFYDVAAVRDCFHRLNYLW